MSRPTAVLEALYMRPNITATDHQLIELPSPTRCLSFLISLGTERQTHEALGELTVPRPFQANKNIVCLFEVAHALVAECEIDEMHGW